MVTVHSSQGSDFILPAQHSLKRGAGTAGSEVGDSGGVIHPCQSAPPTSLEGTSVGIRPATGL